MSKRSVPVIGLAAALVLSVGCTRQERMEAADGGSSTREANTALTVAGIDVGRALAPDKSVSDGADEFHPGETIYVSVHTTGAGHGTLTANWTYQDGRLVDETSQGISPDGSARTEFHISKAKGLPVGKYRVEIRLNGDVVGTKDFEVKR